MSFGIFPMVLLDSSMTVAGRVLILPPRHGFVSECVRPRCTSKEFFEAEVAQVSNLLCRRLPVGRACKLRSAGGLEIRDTADWKSALRGSMRPARGGLLKPVCLL